MSHRITLVCDNCDQNYMMEEHMDMPPHWIGMRLCIADKDGLVPPHEVEDVIDLNFCSQECAAVYLSGEVFKERIALVDQKEEKEEEDDDG